LAAGLIDGREAGPAKASPYGSLRLHDQNRQVKIVDYRLSFIFSSFQRFLIECVSIRNGRD